MSSCPENIIIFPLNDGGPENFGLRKLNEGKPQNKDSAGLDFWGVRGVSKTTFSSKGSETGNQYRVNYSQKNFRLLQIKQIHTFSKQMKNIRHNILAYTFDNDYKFLAKSVIYDIFCQKCITEFF